MGSEDNTQTEISHLVSDPLTGVNLFRDFLLSSKKVMSTLLQQYRAIRCYWIIFKFNLSFLLPMLIVTWRLFFKK